MLQLRISAAGWLVRPLLIATAILLLAPPAAAEEGGAMYTGDLGQALAEIVIFLLLLAVLGRWAWKPRLT